MSTNRDAAASRGKTMSNATGPNANLRVYGSGRFSTSVPNAATVRFV